MRFLAIFVFTVLLSTISVAEECDVDLKYNIRVSSEFLEVSDEKEVLYEIVQGGALTMRGEPVDLNARQKRLAEEYAGEVAALVPQWINLVSNALIIAEEAIRVAFTAALNDDGSAANKSAQSLADVRQRFEKSSSEENGVYSISMTSFDELDGAFSDDFSEDIEDIVMSSLGAMFVQIGKALLSSDQSFDQSMEAFGERMDRMGEELEIMGEGLEDAAEELCDGVKRIQALEESLAQEIPELAGYTLFES